MQRRVAAENWGQGVGYGTRQARVGVPGCDRVGGSVGCWGGVPPAKRTRLGSGWRPSLNVLWHAHRNEMGGVPTARLPGYQGVWACFRLGAGMLCMRSGAFASEQQGMPAAAEGCFKGGRSGVRVQGLQGAAGFIGGGCLDPGSGAWPRGCCRQGREGTQPGQGGHQC